VLIRVNATASIVTASISSFLYEYFLLDGHHCASGSCEIIVILYVLSRNLMDYAWPRGLLLMMSVDHSPSSFRRFTDQPLDSSPPLNDLCSSQHFSQACSFVNAPRSSGSPRLARLRFTGLHALPGTSRHALFRIYSGQLLLTLLSPGGIPDDATAVRCQKFIGR
jgi:hypothetical protein